MKLPAASSGESSTVRNFANLYSLANPTASGGECARYFSSTEQEMMKRVDRGLIVNDFWYIRYVDRKRGELTGMTRDGVMYFENGKVHHTVNNFRWNEIPHEVTRRLIDSGKSLPYNGNFRIPTLLINDFNFVDTTNF